MAPNFLQAVPDLIEAAKEIGVKLRNKDETVIITRKGKVLFTFVLSSCSPWDI